MAKLVEGVDYELTTFTDFKKSLKNSIFFDDNNDGYEYGIKWLHHEFIDISWFNTVEERQQALDEEILQN